MKQRRAGEAAHLDLVLAVQANASQGGVGRDHRVDPAVQRHGGDIVQPGLIEIRSDLQEHRDLARQPGARLHHTGQKRRQRRLALQVPQFFGVGRGDVDGGKIQMRTAMAQHFGEIQRAIGAVLVGPEVQADHPAGGTGCEPVADGLHALIVEAKTIDRGPVLAQAEQARSGVAGLRAWRRRADLDKAKPRVAERRQCLGVLVEPGRQTDGIGQAEAGNLCLQTP
ncbi:hypothetical protein TRIHO_39800 [Tritonibacter horizontis]|uniref:Uncharacterized protein n=1 Tax=Tritonibacter horizontis TaxID=1768241 RepID=A0A132BSH8_9RHOB|nr:hypothetical protein TRIHO_39800 [Tritonibacter horizontis]